MSTTDRLVDQGDAKLLDHAGIVLVMLSTEMTLRYASLGRRAIRTAYEEARNKARTRLTLAIAPVGQPHHPRAGRSNEPPKQGTTPDSAPRAG